jgi:hypothetical protein
VGEGEAGSSQVHVGVEGLQGETWYCAELVVHNEDGTAFGGQIDFKTLAASTPLKTKPEELPLPVQTISPYERPADPNIGEWDELSAQRVIDELREREAAQANAQATKEASERQARETSEREVREASERERAAALRCTVPHLRDRSLAAAREALAKSNCRLGRVNRPAHRRVLVVVAQSVPAGRELSNAAAVDVKLGPPARAADGAHRS